MSPLKQFGNMHEYGLTRVCSGHFRENSRKCTSWEADLDMATKIQRERLSVQGKVNWTSTSIGKYRQSGSESPESL